MGHSSLVVGHFEAEMVLTGPRLPINDQLVFFDGGEIRKACGLIEDRVKAIDAGEVLEKGEFVNDDAGNDVDPDLEGMKKKNQKEHSSHIK